MKLRRQGRGVWGVEIEAVRTIFSPSVGSVCPGIEADRDTHVLCVMIRTSPPQDPKCK